MPYAADGQISHGPLEGGIAITEAQYAEALAGMLAGEHVQVIGGALVVGPLPEVEPEPDPEPTMEQRRQRLTVANNAGYEAAIGELTADYPPSEIATWERQRAEAIAWEADPQAPTPWIDTAAFARQLDREVYLARTVAKVHAFAAASAYLTGRRQFIDDAIRAAETADDLADVQIDYTLPGAP